MKNKRLGRTGLQVSEICLGTMTFGHQADETESRAILDLAFEAGVYFIDTADMYPLGAERNEMGRTEEIIGRWMKERGNRSQIVLATKCRVPMGTGPNQGGLSRRYILSAVEASLRRLQTDTIDLYYAHSPDAETPIEETMAAFDQLVRDGKVRYLGGSNYQAWDFGRALWASDKAGLHRYEALQPRYNILFRSIETDLVPLCRDQNVAIVAYNPLAGGLLTGRHRKGKPPEPGTRFSLGGPMNMGEVYRKRYWRDDTFDVVAELEGFFRGRGESLITASVSWVLQQPGLTSAIIGASRADQLGASLAATGFRLDEEALRVCGEAWYRLPRDPDPKTSLR
jgi:aryl-alcohol dehydrogenase-like predicted oxidoreductase